MNNDDSVSTWFETGSDNIKRYSMRVTVNAEFRSAWDFTGAEAQNVMRLGKLRCMLGIGDAKFIFNGDGYIGSWTDYSIPVDDSDCFVLVYAYDDKERTIDMDDMNNKTYNNATGAYYDSRTVNLDFFAPYPNRKKFSGDLKFSILNRATVEDVNENDQTSKLKYVKINSVRITLYDKYGNEIDDSNVEYTAKGDESFQKEADGVQTILGTNLNNVPVEFGSLMKYNSGGWYEFVTGLTEQHTGTIDVFENIVLKNYIKQNEVSRIVLDCNINQISPIGYITYGEFFPNKKFRVQSIRSDLENMSDEVKLIEIVL